MSGYHQLLTKDAIAERARSASLTVASGGMREITSADLLEARAAAAISDEPGRRELMRDKAARMLITFALWLQSKEAVAN